MDEMIPYNKNKIVKQGADIVSLIDLFVNKNYLADITDENKCVPMPLEPQSFANLSLFKISKIVYSKDENPNDKLISVYNALSSYGSSIFTVVVGKKDGVEFYIGTRDNDLKRADVAKYILEKGLRGNFPGIELSSSPNPEVARLLEASIPTEYIHKAITAVSIVPGTRDDDKENFVQGIEKFIEAMNGEEYTAMFISSPLSKNDIENKRSGYEQLYSQLSQFAQINMTYAKSDSSAIAVGTNDSFTQSINESVSMTAGTNSSRTSSYNKGTSHSEGKTDSNSLWGWTIGSNWGNSTSEGVSNSETYGDSRSETNQRGSGESRTSGKSSTETTTLGSTETLAITYQNKTVQQLLLKIDEQLERLKSCEAYGLWESACYFIADRQETAIVAANEFRALVAGEQTSVENSYVNLWDNSSEKYSETLMSYLRYAIHPQFEYLSTEIPSSINEAYTDNGQKIPKRIVNPASLISGSELSVLMGLPLESVRGLTVVESAPFAVNVSDPSGKYIEFGSLYHMGNVYDRNRIRLDLNSLTSHCLIVGSTGSGKSNTTYKIIQDLIKKDIPFLIIEPTKGEYKTAFGKMYDEENGFPKCNIFTTNPNYFDMLCINPFEFPNEIHILEHLDGLIEIFSACWPLYAAMPSILKSAFELSYIKHGWDLNNSFYIDRGNGKYPTFSDVIGTLAEVITSSKFAGEARSNYEGALGTRIRSLTNGLFRQIFSSESIPDNVLFDKKTIIDLSRIQSPETKALIMGILVLKLTEYRRSTATTTNSVLKHITILEEAHHLLKKTSTDQGQESSNVQGKSVEMISNSIAEMRTYGEGFIIVDQSPTTLDVSAVKNTNTKIIMNLPEANDCEVVGRSISLNDDQIRELSKLQQGVAVVFQRRWAEAVLTKIDRCSSKYEIEFTSKQDRSAATRKYIGTLLIRLYSQHKSKTFDLRVFNFEDVDGVSPTLLLNMRHYFDNYKFANQNNPYAIEDLIFNVMNCEDLFRIFEHSLPRKITKFEEITEEDRKVCRLWAENIFRYLDRYADFKEKEDVKNFVFSSLLRYLGRNDDKKNLYKTIHYVLNNSK
jgi:DNA helicase HerA-like ATPase